MPAEPPAADTTTLAPRSDIIIAAHVDRPDQAWPVPGEHGDGWHTLQPASTMPSQGHACWGMPQLR